MNMAILQARVSSTRLPGKVLKPIMGYPMLQRQIQRVQRAATIDFLVVATSTQDSDAPLADLCTKLGIPCFRGSLEDVLDRYYQAAKPYQPDHVIRLTGDCPLADPGLIDTIVNHHLKGGFDYTSNTIDPTYPDGLDVEVFTFAALTRAWNDARLLSEREHVTPFIKKNPDVFSISNVTGPVDYSHLRWTVDEPEDFQLITRIYEALYPQNPEFTTEQILDLFENHPEMLTINNTFDRDEGYKRSLLQDRMD